MWRLVLKEVIFFVTLLKIVIECCTIHKIGNNWLNYVCATLSQEEAPPVREEAFTSTHKPITVDGQTQVTVGTTHISRLTDDQLIKEFLSGSYCLHGVRHVHLRIAPEWSFINYSVACNHLDMCVSGCRVVEIWILLWKARPSVPRGMGPSWLMQAC